MYPITPVPRHSERVYHMTCHPELSDPHEFLSRSFGSIKDKIGALNTQIRLECEKILLNNFHLSFINCVFAPILLLKKFVGMRQIQNGSFKWCVILSASFCEKDLPAVAKFIMVPEQEFLRTDYSSVKSLTWCYSGLDDHTY